MSESLVPPAPHYYMLVQGKNIRESIKVSSVRETAIVMAERYYYKNKPHRVILVAERFDAKTGVRTFEKVWSSINARPDLNRKRV